MKPTIRQSKRRWTRNIDAVWYANEMYKYTARPLSQPTNVVAFSISVKLVLTLIREKTKESVVIDILLYFIIRKPCNHKDNFKRPIKVSSEKI